MNDHHSPRRLREYVLALGDFRTAYIAYLNAPEEGIDGEELAKLRSRVTTSIAKASAALDAARIGMGQMPPPALGGYRIEGFANLVFLHERTISAGDTPRFIIDAVETAMATLEAQREEEIRRRRNPLYWLDRLLRAVLGIPAYLISIIFRVPLARIEESTWGTALRLLTLAVDVGLLVFGAHEWFGWF